MKKPSRRKPTYITPIVKTGKGISYKVPKSDTRVVLEMPQVPRNKKKGKLKQAQTKNPPLEGREASQKIIKLLLLKNWLLSGKTITARQCSKMFGYDRCADGIWKLRNAPHHMNIETILKSGEDRFLNNVEYAVYKWLGEVPVISSRPGSRGKVKTYNFFHKLPKTLATIRQDLRDYVTKKLKAKVNWIFKLKNGHFMADTSKGKKIFVVHHVQQKVQL